MTTEALRISSSALWLRLGALWERLLKSTRRSPKCLRLCESLPLGERRFVAVVEFEKSRFLVGGTPSALVLLSRLADSREQGARQEDLMGAWAAEEKPTEKGRGEK